MRIATLLLALVLAGCASLGDQAPINPIASEATQASPTGLDVEDDVVVLALSGGGARSAAFSLGAMQGLRETRAADGRSLLDRVRLITAVSGGAVLAAYYGQHGPAGLDTFRHDFLDKNWAARLHTNLYSPLNWARALSGQMNDQRHVAEWLDREVFDHGTMGQLWGQGGPQVWINATDLYNGTTFAFAPLYFDALCSDLASVRIADAVAASMAFPVMFQPVLAAPHADHCGPPPAWAVSALADHQAAPALVRRTAQAFAAYRDPHRQPYLHLVDGGVLDNLGLTSLSLVRETARTPFGPLSERDAVRLRHMMVVVVNAEQIRSSSWQLTSRGPNGLQTLGALTSIIIESPNRSSFDSFHMLVSDWERELREYRCALPAEAVARLRGDMTGWNCADVHLSVEMISFADLDETSSEQLGHVPTSVSLRRAQIDALIAAGRRGIAENARIQAMSQ